jgi:hypothetical protein
MNNNTGREIMPEEPRSSDSMESNSYREELNPDNRAGMNYDLKGPHPEKKAHTAYDVKEAHRRLQGLSDEELKQIPILPTGSRLEQGATYINLKDEQPTEFTATSDMEAKDGGWFVPKSEVGYPLWNRLIGVDNDQRLDEQGR